VSPKRSSLSIPESVERRAAPQVRPRIVFAREGSSGSERVSRQSGRILVVEDDYLVATQVEIALTDAGFDVAGVATSAAEAIQLAGEHRPELVVMDVRLSGPRDGIDAAVELFRTLGIRCVFATAHSDDAVRQRAQPAAPLAWVRKPYTMATLVAAVRRAIRDL
jgi:DNA-binding NarL/FixJ family response regulator